MRKETKKERSKFLKNLQSQLNKENRKFIYIDFGEDSHGLMADCDEENMLQAIATLANSAKEGGVKANMIMLALTQGLNKQDVESEDIK